MLRARIHQEEGFSLVELMVALMLLGVVGSVAVAGIVTGLRSTTQAETRVAALNDLQKGIERVGRELRAAEELRFELGSDPADVVTAQIVRGGERVRYRYYLVPAGDGEAAELREDVRRETLGGTLIDSRDGLFIANIANNATDTPLFTYYTVHPVSRQLVEIDCDTSTATCLQRHATATQVRLTLQRLLPEQEPITVETVVNIRSARLGGA